MTATKPYDIEVKRPDGGYPIVIAHTDRIDQPLVAIADIHRGASNHDDKRYRYVVKWIADNQALWVGLGDWNENASKHSVGAGWVEQVESPQEQIDNNCDILSPISHLCMGAIIGNHEERTWKETGINPMMVMCDKLSIPYLGHELFAEIVRDKECSYTLYGVHSTSTSKTTSLEENMVERDWMKFLSFDLIAKAHGHSLKLTEPKYRFDIDKMNKAVTVSETRIWFTGNYLGRVDSYASAKPYQPKPMGTVAVWLTMDKRNRRIRGEEIAV